MNYIAIETSTNICSVALFKSNEMIGLIENEEKKSHSKELSKLKYVDWVVKDINEAELNYINNFNIKKT